MPADFMSYFPCYIHPSTIKNCREYMITTLNVENLEQAMDKMAPWKISPVNVILSYAYYFERDLYEWHIDLLSSIPLDEFNKKFVAKTHSLTQNDLLPKLHQSIHRRHYKAQTGAHVLTQAICYTYLHGGRTPLPNCC